MDNIFTLKNRVAIVTGATKGIGKAIAIKMANAGVKVAVVGRDAERAHKLVNDINADGGEAIAMLADISDENVCKRVCDEVYTKYQQIDILVNCRYFGQKTKSVEVKLHEIREILLLSIL